MTIGEMSILVWLVIMVICFICLTWNDMKDFVKRKIKGL